MLFTAYFDESDTHDPARRMIMAGFLGSAREWVLFERKINVLRRKYGFHIFHAKEFRSSDGEFRDWTLKKKMTLVNELATMIRDGLTEGVIAVLSRADYDRYYRGTSFPKRMPADSQYGICFRICLHHLLNRLTAEGKQHRLNLISS